MASHVRAHFDVRVFDRRDAREDAAGLGVRFVSLSEAASSDVMVLAVPVQHLEELLGQLGPMLAGRREALVIDVCSVKMRPIALMTRLLPATVRIVGTHPLFGPQSGKDGIAGLPIALCRARANDDTVASVAEFLTRTLQLNVIEVAAEEHDRKMAYVQGLTHLITRAISEMNLPDGSDGLATAAYRRLLGMRSNLREDSLDLFLTIERENPFAEAARREFRKKLEEMERVIGSGSSSQERGASFTSS